MDWLGLKASDRRRLDQILQQTCDAKLYRRVFAILEVHRGRTVEEVADELEVTRQSVYNWLQRFDAHDCEASLKSRPQTGRPRALAGGERVLLNDLMQIRPGERGYFANEWTVPLLRDELQHVFGRRVSTDTVRRGLRRLGYVWKRPRYVLSPDPDKLKKTPDFCENPRSAASQRGAC